MVYDPGMTNILVGNITVVFHEDVTKKRAKKFLDEVAGEVFSSADIVSVGSEVAIMGEEQWEGDDRDSFR